MAEREYSAAEDARSRPGCTSASASLANRSIAPEEYTIGWICALSVEMAAAKGMLDRVHPNLSQQAPQDHNSYILGEIQGHKIVIAGLPKGVYGTTSAASVAKDLLRTFKSIRFGLMVGIGGAAPSQTHDIRLGDVVVGVPTGTNGGVIQYDRGKKLQKDDSERTGSLNMPPNILLTALTRLDAVQMTEESRVPEFIADLVSKSPKRMKSKFSYQGISNDHLYLPDYEHINPNSTCQECDKTKTVQREDRDGNDTDPVIHYGAIASGNQVIEDAKTRDRLSEELGVLCFEMEAAGLQDFPSLVIRGICDYSDSHKNKLWQEYAAASAAAFTKELLLVITPDRVLLEKNIPELLHVAEEQLRVLEQHREISSMHLEEYKRTNQSRPLDLPVIHEACYDSADVGESPRCEKDTRLRFREAVAEWADQDSGEPILWLIGPAGTGKSTIARSIADSLDAQKRLAGTYFFKRGEQSRNDTSRFFSTLASQFANNIPCFRGYLQTSLDGLDKGAVEKKSLRSQFDQLLWHPLSELKHLDPHHLPKVIIIDALDECERPEHLETVVALLSKLSNIKSLRLRTFVASRSTRQTSGAFRSILKDGLVRSLELHRDFPGDAKTDIRTFLNRKFEEIKERCKFRQNPWPSSEDYNRLVHLATNPDPLFIYAATLFRFIYDEKRPRNPKSQLHKWLKDSDRNISQLHQMYNPVLCQVFNDNEETCRDLLQFLGTIILLVTPLPAVSITSLLQIERDDIEWWIPDLQAVLDIPTNPRRPIRLLHKSFSDFLLSTGSRFQVNAAETHGLLTEKCIQRMKTSLRRDICDLREPGIFKDEIDRDKINVQIPPDLEYACLHWFHHFKSSERPLGQNISTFLYEHLPHWLEVLTLLGRLAQGEVMLRELCKASDSDTNFEHFVQDARRVISTFGSAIELAPLQIYGSLLFFSPVSSKIRQAFWDKRIPQRGQVQGVKNDWDARLQSVGDDDGSITALCFSPDGQLLAFAWRRWREGDHKVQLCNPITGTDLQTLDSHESFVHTMAFSADGLRLVLGCNDGSIRIWNMATVELEHCIWVNGGPVRAIGFSDATHFLSLSHCGIVAVCDISTGKCENETKIFERLEGLTESDDLGAEARPAAISPCTQLVAWSERSGTVGLLNLAGDSCQLSLRGHTYPIFVLAFSLDSKLLASASQHGMICVWDVKTGAQKHKMDHLDDVEAVAFSPNGQFLASGSLWETRLWNAKTATCYASFPYPGKSLAFSPDGRLLASASGNVQLLDTTLNQCKESSGNHNAWIEDITWSPDGQLVASASLDGTVQIRDSSTGAQKCALQKTITGNLGSTRTVDYSPDSQLIASVSYSSNTQVQLWQVATRKLIRTLEIQEPLNKWNGRQTTIHFAIFSPDGSTIAAAFNNGWLVRWDTSTGKLLQIFENHSHIRKIVFSMDGQLMAGFRTQGLAIWNSTSSSPIHSLDLETYAVSFSPDNQLIAIADYSNILTMWFYLVVERIVWNTFPDDILYQGLY
ncbi:putative WD-repeat protein [Fusarium austroafricanum]|uniref:Putative WD-repeat protein n=1 Tax=Fusarium austroafricanum TaxID=2364996 RepID=A0A8H4NPT6_9HYPO|nr:putative WD-repeat protein [Fusarium austroafricanum]